MFLFEVYELTIKRFYPNIQQIWNNNQEVLKLKRWLKLFLNILDVNCPSDRLTYIPISITVETAEFREY